jgi:hypothetical protein
VIVGVGGAVGERSAEAGFMIGLAHSLVFFRIFKNEN